MFLDDEEAEIAVDIQRVYTVKVPATSLGQKEVIKPVLQSAKHKDPSIVTTHYDVERKRLFYGMDNGAVCFWPLTETAANTSRFVGVHKGPVSAIATPRKKDGDLGKAGLIVTGSVDSTIKIWDYQVRSPSLCTPRLARSSMHSFGGWHKCSPHRPLPSSGRACGGVHSCALSTSPFCCNAAIADSQPNSCSPQSCCSTCLPLPSTTLLAST